MGDSTGKCELCGGVFPRRAMTVHLKSCIKPGRPDKTGKAVAGFHVFIEARYLPEYWLHILIPADVKLQRLDSFLREVWLECCGHLSEFRIAGVSYQAAGDPDAASWGKPSRRMSARLKDVLEVGTTFEYDYDFGSTTALRLKVLGEAETAARGVALIARNEPPPIVCSRCKRHPAEVICTECGDGHGWMCNACATGEEHECGDEMLLPVVNSPRAGVCGYTG